MAQSLHHAILCPLNSGQAAPQPTHRLVVGAVHPAHAAADRPQGRRCRSNHMEAIFPTHSAVARNILTQRAAEKHIDDLCAPADAQRRLPGSSEAFQQRQLRRIPLRLQSPGRRIFLSVPLGLHIPSAGQQQRIAALCLSPEAHSPAGGLHRPPVIAVPLRVSPDIDCSHFYLPSRHFIPRRAVLLLQQ